VFRGDIYRSLRTAEFRSISRLGLVDTSRNIWSSTIAVCREARRRPASPQGHRRDRHHHQRETTVVWDRATGQAVHRAIVWQDRRTADICARLKAEAMSPRYRPKPA
jgi:glycerol kinase